MLDADAYNARKLSEGEITADLISQLVRYWQHGHDLVVDGKLGNNTATSIRGMRLGTALMTRALYFAKNDLGRGETVANNKGLWLDTVRSSDGTGLPWKGYDAPWCASVLSSWFTRAEHAIGSEGLVPWKASRGARALGMWLAEHAFTNELPEPGAIGIYKRGLPGSRKGHSVIFESYDPKTDTAVTIEGNVGKFPAKVKRVTYTNGAWRKKLIGVYSF